MDIGGGDQHLEGYRDHRAEDPDRGGARGGPAVELPEIALVEKTAEEAHPGLRPDPPRLGKPAIEKAPRHSFVRWSPSANHRLSGGNRRPTIRGPECPALRALAAAASPAGGDPGRGRLTAKRADRGRSEPCGQGRSPSCSAPAPSTGSTCCPGSGPTALLPAALLLAAASRDPRATAGGWCAAGFLWALLNAHATIASRLPSALDGEDLVLTGRIASVPAVAPRRTRFDFDVENGLPHGEGRLRLSWYEGSRGDPPELVTGETWRLVVRLRAPRGIRNPGGFDYETWLFRHGYAGQGYVRARDPRVRRLAAAGPLDPGRIRHALSRRLREIPEIGPAGALVEALVVGVRDRITGDQRETLRRTGTAHLLAISGLHIGLAAGLGFAVGRFAGPWLVPGVAPVRLGAVAGMAMAAGYAALAGFSLPTRRALVMATVLLVALCARRRLGGSTVFCLGLMAVLVLEPRAVLDPGLLAVVLRGRACSCTASADGCIRRRPRWLDWRRWGLPQIVVTVGLAPLVLQWFGEQPVAGPLANAVAIPFVGDRGIAGPARRAAFSWRCPEASRGPGGRIPGRGRGPAALDVAVDTGLELVASYGPRYTLAVEPSIATTTILAMVGGRAIVLAPAGRARAVGRRTVVRSHCCGGRRRPLDPGELRDRVPRRRTRARRGRWRPGSRVLVYDTGRTCTPGTSSPRTWHGAGVATSTRWW